MAKDILLYGRIDEYNARFVNSQIDEATEKVATEELIMRINSEGGDPDYGISVAEQVNALADQISIRVGAQFHSTAFFLALYIPKEKIQCIDLTKSVVHRAAYPEWYESQSWFEGSVQQQLMASTNKDFEKAMRARIDVEAFENLPQMKSNGYTLKDIFSLESRIEIVLTANDLKKIGLVGKVNKITPTANAILEKQAAAFIGCRSIEEFKMAAQKLGANAPEKATPEKPKDTIMTLAEFKAQYPAIYAEAKAEGYTEGLTTEKDRVEAMMVFNEIDPVGVKAAIESGKPLTSKQMAEFSLKAMNASALEKVEKDSTGKIITKEVETPKTEKEKKTAEFEALVDKSLDKKG